MQTLIRSDDDRPACHEQPRRAPERNSAVTPVLEQQTSFTSMGPAMTSVSELLAANLHDVFGNRDPLTRRAAIAWV